MILNMRLIFTLLAGLCCLNLSLLNHHAYGAQLPLSEFGDLPSDLSPKQQQEDIRFPNVLILRQAPENVTTPTPTPTPQANSTESPPPTNVTTPSTSTTDTTANTTAITTSTTTPASNTTTSEPPAKDASTTIMFTLLIVIVLLLFACLLYNMCCGNPDTPNRQPEIDSSKDSGKGGQDVRAALDQPGADGILKVATITPPPQSPAAQMDSSRAALTPAVTVRSAISVDAAGSSRQSSPASTGSVNAAPGAISAPSVSPSVSEGKNQAPPIPARAQAPPILPPIPPRAQALQQHPQHQQQQQQQQPPGATKIKKSTINHPALHEHGSKNKSKKSRKSTKSKGSKGPRSPGLKPQAMSVKRV